jgi:copper resistance protein D
MEIRGRPRMRVLVFLRQKMLASTVPLDSTIRPTLHLADIAFALILLFMGAPFASSAQQDMQDMPGMDMQHNQEELTPARKAKLAADKRESEFNHHLAGILLILAGAFLFAQDKLATKWAWARYVWPACFLAAGFYLLIFSDTEIWPIGHKPFWLAMSDPEDQQHKVFAVILLSIGLIELQRARGRLQNAWAAWVFPVTGMIGAVMLLFHHHQAGMHGPDHMALMHHVQKEHRGFALAGGGIALAKGLSEIQWTWHELFKKIWPLLLIVLGILLTLYTE